MNYVIIDLSTRLYFKNIRYRYTSHAQWTTKDKADTWESEKAALEFIKHCKVWGNPYLPEFVEIWSV